MSIQTAASHTGGTCEETVAEPRSLQARTLTITSSVHSISRLLSSPHEHRLDRQNPTECRTFRRLSLVGSHLSSNSAEHPQREATHPPKAPQPLERCLGMQLLLPDDSRCHRRPEWARGHHQSGAIGYAPARPTFHPNLDAGGRLRGCRVGC